MQGAGRTTADAVALAEWGRANFPQADIRPLAPWLEDVSPLSRRGLMLGKINILVSAGMGVGVFSLWAMQVERTRTAGCARPRAQQQTAAPGSPHLNCTLLRPRTGALRRQTNTVERDIACGRDPGERFSGATTVAVRQWSVHTSVSPSK